METDEGRTGAARSARAAGPERYERSEPQSQQLDRNWNEQLQETRVLQTGTQILAAFLIVLPFQHRFEELDRFQTGWYLGLLVLAVATVAVLLTPVSLHRMLFQRGVKDRLVAVTNWVLKIALALVALLLAGVTLLIFDVVVSRITGVVTGAILLLFGLGLQLVLPRLVARHIRA